MEVSLTSPLANSILSSAYHSLSFYLYFIGIILVTNFDSQYLSSLSPSRLANPIQRTAEQWGYKAQSHRSENAQTPYSYRTTTTKNALMVNLISKNLGPQFDSYRTVPGHTLSLQSTG